MNIALIEFGASHAECIHSQIIFMIKAGYKVHLFHNEKLQLHQETKTLVTSSKSYKISKIKWINILLYQRLYKIFKKKSIDQIIINTLENRYSIGFLRQSKKKHVSVAGILHNVHRYEEFINLPVQKFFVLSRLLFDNLTVQLTKNAQASYFYPIYHPNIEVMALKKNPFEFWVCIPGQVESKRRDYKLLLDQIEKVKTIPENLKFILLGKSFHKHGIGNEIERRLTELGCVKNFILFEDFVNDTTFHSYLNASDIILPLIHKDNPEYKHYQSTKISGTFNLAFSYKKPLFMESGFESLEEFDGSSLFYNKDNLLDTLVKWSQNKADTFLYKEKGYRKFDAQQKRYIGLLGD